MEIDYHITPHLPKHYVAGAYVFQHEIWVGDFMATGDELFDYATSPNTGLPEYELIHMMINTQQWYETWWEKLKHKHKK